MRKRDTVVLTLGTAAIVVLLLLLFTNVFVYLPLKTLYGGPAETATAATGLECTDAECTLTLEPTVFDHQQNVTAFAVYAGTYDSPPDKQPLSVISRPTDGTWNDEVVTKALPSKASYTIVARQSYTPEVSGLARTPYSVLYKPLFGQPPDASVVTTVKGRA